MASVDVVMSTIWLMQKVGNQPEEFEDVEKRVMDFYKKVFSEDYEGVVEVTKEYTIQRFSLEIDQVLSSIPKSVQQLILNYINNQFSVTSLINQEYYMKKTKTAIPNALSFICGLYQSNAKFRALEVDLQHEDRFYTPAMKKIVKFLLRQGVEIDRGIRFAVVPCGGSSWQLPAEGQILQDVHLHLKAVEGNLWYLYPDFGWKPLAIS